MIDFQLVAYDFSVTEDLVRIWFEVSGIIGDDRIIFVVYKPEYIGEVIGVYGVIVLFIISSTCVLSTMCPRLEGIFRGRSFTLGS